MCKVNAVEVVGRSRKGGFKPVQNTSADAITVWGEIDGHAFRRVFSSSRAWRAWRNLQRSNIEVLGMQSGEVL
jgi:hypothetical protein